MLPAVDWREEDNQLKPFVKLADGTEVVAAWAPQPGSQEAFMTSPVFETLYAGTRGPGKTDALIMDFAQHVGPDMRTEEQKDLGYPQTAGWGAEWRGVLFRQTYPQLTDVITKTRKWFPKIFPAAVFNEQKTMWTWPTGEALLFRHGLREADYWNYHGHAYPWLGYEELTTWPDLSFYKKMFSCCRSTVRGMPRKCRATTNPYGIGHNAVKLRFGLPLPPGRIIGDIIRDEREDVAPEDREPPRVVIVGHLDENKILMAAEPGYKGKLRAAAKNKAELDAWLDGSWDITAGGMFDDIWDPKVHVVPDFDVPSSWRIDRSFDWGSSKPFSVGWWAESDGSDLRMRDGRVCSTVRGDLFRVREWYGCQPGQENVGLKMLAADIAKGIVERELKWNWHGRVKSGPADNSIHDVENGMSIARDMGAQVRIDGTLYSGVVWTRADKRPGSRKNGWELMRKMFDGAKKRPGQPRETPGLFVTESCADFRRTVPVIPRDLDGDPDDVDTHAEDHIADETRYRVRFAGQMSKSGRVRGV